MAERKSTEADDVFEFLESLPQTGRDGTGDKGDKQKSKNNEDIMEFLDELEKSNLSLSKKGRDAEKPKQETAEASKETAATERPGAESKRKEAEAVEEPLHDPITSLSKWWSSSGSATVSSFWNKTTEQASSIKTKLAQDQLDLSSKLSAAAITDLARNLQKMVARETDEVLRIHLVHDLVNFPQLQYNVEQKFDQVLSSQVQGGIRIFVDQWGHPHKSAEDAQSKSTSVRKLNIFNGKIADGEKLAFANLDNAIRLFDTAHEEYMKQQEQSREHTADDGSSKDGISDIFISILPIAVPGNNQKAGDDIPTTDSVHAGNFSFTIILKDITNGISSITRSQGFPMKWVGWLEGESNWKPKHAREQPKEEDASSGAAAEDDEEEIVDPSDWVKEWVEDGLFLSLGVVAQNYVIERMGF
ncbi:hypothetical protein HG536_0F01170 [Torulaspora globosa]|uniref:Maintenance of telomere capping protein 1 n=1 Tax=Torulaspora globosa TaxID=48254 RepID=A0A7G3ZJV6_9SACH|nr:uncharacterized protein HG536_0F01170 [Torulaspora globosa]QLL33792.1 hypothetical protein HG536_0F01170 [Torulaspora globosa]